MKFIDLLVLRKEFLHFKVFSAFDLCEVVYLCYLLGKLLDKILIDCPHLAKIHVQALRNLLHKNLCNPF